MSIAARSIERDEIYGITYSQQAKEDLKRLKKHEQRTIVSAVDLRLRHEPTVETRNRKRLRPNPTAEWELRLGKVSVLYNVAEEPHVVEIRRVGEKRGSVLTLGGVQEDVP